MCTSESPSCTRFISLGANVCIFIKRTKVCLKLLRSQAAAALESDGFSCDVFGVGAGEEYAYAADVVLRVCEVAERNALYGLCVEVGVVFLPLLEAFGHRERADDVDSDTVRSPFCSCHP